MRVVPPQLVPSSPSSSLSPARPPLQRGLTAASALQSGGFQPCGGGRRQRHCSSREGLVEEFVVLPSGVGHSWLCHRLDASPGKLVGLKMRSKSSLTLVNTIAPQDENSRNGP